MERAGSTVLRDADWKSRATFPHFFYICEKITRNTPRTTPNSQTRNSQLEYHEPIHFKTY